jgi:type IV pilus assembly protein PilQ
MRKQLLGLLVPLLAFVLIAAAADTTGKGVAASARLQRLEVAHSQDGLRVEFKAKGTLAPKVTTLESPARIVVDFPNTVMARRRAASAWASDGVKDVRIGHGRPVPPSTRVVVDLAAAIAAAASMNWCGPRTAASFSRFTTLCWRIERSRRRASAGGRTAAPANRRRLRLRQPFPSGGRLPATSAPATTSPAPAPAPAAAREPEKPADLPLSSPSLRTEDAKRPSRLQRPRKRPAALPTRRRRNWLPPPAMPRWGKLGAARASRHSAGRESGGRAEGADGKQKPAANGAKYTGEPISVNLKDVDLKDFFRLIHEISGLNVVLDPTIHGNLTIVLDDVPWDQALDIVLKNNDLSRQLDGNVLRIATVDTLRRKRRTGARRSMPRRWRWTKSASRASSATPTPRTYCCRSRSS